MKVALILTGHLRGFRSCYPSIKNYILDKYDTDVFISTWKGENCLHKNGTMIAGDHSGEVFDLYPDAKYHFEDHEKYYFNRFPNIEILDRENDVFSVDERAALNKFWLERIRDQWYIVKKGYELIENPEKYDIIIRLRLDMNLSHLDLYKFDGIVTKFLGPAPEYCTNDWVAFGSSEAMKHYCLVFDHMEDLYVKHNIDISFAECMLGYYLQEYCNINMRTDEIGLHGVDS